MARPAAEIDPQLSIFSSSRILPGPIRPSRSRSIRTLKEGSNLGDDLVSDDLRTSRLAHLQRRNRQSRSREASRLSSRDYWRQ
jgi:hypothetical protein